MPAWFQFPFLFGVPLLPARRVIAIDPGTHEVKVVVAEVFLDRLRFLQRVSFVRPMGMTAKEGLEGTQRKLHELLRQFDQYPLALTTPQHLVLSQAIDLPRVADAAVKQMIQNEALKLAGLSQMRVAWDYAPLRPFGKHDHAYWLTLCQENEVTLLSEQLNLPRADLCEVTSSGNALRAAYLALFPHTEATVLVNLGVRSTTISLLLEGQGLLATSFGLGTEFFDETLTTQKGNRTQGKPEADYSLDQVTQIKREKNLFSGPDTLPAYCEAVDSWRGELVRIVQEWLLEHPDVHLGLSAFQFVLAGGGAGQPGLVAYLNQKTGLHFQLWPEYDLVPKGKAPGFFAVAEGAAILALGKTPQSASLLPADSRTFWRNQRPAQLVQSISFLLLLVLLLLMLFGTWQKFALESKKRTLLSQVETALDRSEKAKRLTRKLQEDFEQVRPVVERQKRTLDTLQTLALMQQVRSNQNFWLVLFADDQSYFSQSTGTPTNELSLTNLSLAQLPPVTPAPTTPTVRRPGFVAEVVIPGDTEATRRIVSQLVKDLKQDVRFRNVDTIPPEQRRTLADPKTLIADRHFALSLELAASPLDPITMPSKIESSPPGAGSTTVPLPMPPGGLLSPTTEPPAKP